MRKLDILKQLNVLYKERGLNSVNGFLKRNNVKHKVVVHNFGLQGNKVAEKEKREWIATKEKNTFKCHLYALGIKAKSGFNYNRIRAKEIILL